MKTLTAAALASATACFIGGLYAAITPAKAADKGAPATPAQIQALPSPQATTCYVETSAAGTFLRDTREAQAGIGGGCDAKLANLILGGGTRADLADWRNTGSVFAKLGVALNAGVTLYGLAEWKVPEWKIKDAGQLMLGGGTEVKLELVNPNLWLFAEGSFAAAKFGSAIAKDELSTRLGLRLKF